MLVAAIKLWALQQASKDGRSRSTGAEDGVSPGPAEKAIASWEQFEACRVEYNDKFGRLAACQQMCTKFDRCAAFLACWAWHGLHAAVACGAPLPTSDFLFLFLNTSCKLDRALRTIA